MAKVNRLCVDFYIGDEEAEPNLRRMLDIVKLYSDLRRAWSAETAFGEWQEDVPALNQCVPTALVVQDILGGRLRRCKMTDGDIHVWNQIDEALSLDMTVAQFQHTEAQPDFSTERSQSRKSLLRVKHVRDRYELLKSALPRWYL